MMTPERIWTDTLSLFRTLALVEFDIRRDEKMSREKLAIGDRVIASLKSKTVGEIVDTNRFNEVLVAWPNGSTHWINRRHLLLEIEVSLLDEKGK